VTAIDVPAFWYAAIVVLIGLCLIVAGR